MEEIASDLQKTTSDFALGMHTRTLTKELLQNGFLLNDKLESIQPALDLMIDTLCALETDIARNFKVISSKFAQTEQASAKQNTNLESITDIMNSCDAKLESLESRVSCLSDREDEVWRSLETLKRKVQLLSKIHGCLI